METIEFKLKIDDRAWELTPVHYRLAVPYSSFNHELAYEVAKLISMYTGVEVRWEFEGVGQGHYVNY